MNRPEDSKTRAFRTKLARELLAQMKEDFGNRHAFEIDKIIHHHISKLKMVQLTKIKTIQSSIEAKIKNKLNIRRRKFSFQKQRKRSINRKARDWIKKRGSAANRRESILGEERQAEEQGAEVWDPEAERGAESHERIDPGKYINYRTNEEIEEHLKMVGSQRDSLLNSMPKDDQSHMISNLSKLTQKNILNRVSQSKDLFTVERKNKGSTVSRETKVKKFGAKKKVFTSRYPFSLFNLINFEINFL